MTSCLKALDGRDMGLEEALDAVVGMPGFESVILCIPDGLAYYEDESHDRYVCRRPSGSVAGSR